MSAKGFFGVVGGYAGFLIGDVSQHIVFDSNAEEFIMKVGQGSEGLLIKEGLLRYGTPTEFVSFQTYLGFPQVYCNDSAGHSTLRPANLSLTHSLGQITASGGPTTAINMVRGTGTAVSLTASNTGSTLLGTLTLGGSSGCALNQSSLSFAGTPYVGTSSGYVRPNGIYYGGVKVLGNPSTGWLAPTGTVHRGVLNTNLGAYLDTNEAVQRLLHVVGAIITDNRSQGFYGA